MKPDAKYSFKAENYSFPRYFVHEQPDIGIPNFSPEWVSLHSRDRSRTGMAIKIIKSIPNGKQFIMRILGYTPNINRFPHVLLLENASGYIGLYHIPEMADFYYGYYNEDAVLLKFDKKNYKGISRITLWFFKGKKRIAPLLYYKWISCQLELVR